MSENTKTILIIEDERDLSEALATSLQTKGFSVIVAEDSESALTRMSEIRPDLILLDLFTYSIHGIHFIERLQTQPAFRSLPIIIVTNTDSDEQRDRALKLGVKAYLVKAEHSVSDIADMAAQILAS